MTTQNSTLQGWIPASTGGAINGPELARIKQKGRNLFVLIHRERSRWGTWAEISSDIAHFIAYGHLPKSAGKSWA